MGSCLSTPVDFEGEVSLYHFDLHRVVGKGAFGKVSISPSLVAFSYLDLVVSPGWRKATRRARLCGCGSTCSVAFVPQTCCTCLLPLRQLLVCGLRSYRILSSWAFGFW